MAEAAIKRIEDIQKERDEAFANFSSHPALPAPEDGFDIADMAHVLHLILPESDYRNDAIHHITAPTPIDQATLVWDALTPMFDFSGATDIDKATMKTNVLAMLNATPTNDDEKQAHIDFLIALLRKRIAVEVLHEHTELTDMKD